MTGRIAEDKIYVREQLAELGIPVPEAVVLSPSQIHFGRLGTRLGLPFIMQSPNGAGGQGTHLIRSKADLSAALRRQPHLDQWLFSRFAGELTINVAGVVHVDGVHLLPVSVQSSGIAEVGSGFGGYCGSDFGAAASLPAIVLEQTYRHAAAVGDWLRRRGHLGLFGADIAVDAEQIAFLEINPRVQGSSWLLSRLQQQRGEQPCLEEHVEALLGSPVNRTGPAHVGNGSHLIVRWTGPAGVVRRTPPPLAGVSGIPRRGVTVLRGAILARIDSTSSLTSENGQMLGPEASEILDAIHAGTEIG